MTTPRKPTPPQPPLTPKQRRNVLLGTVIFLALMLGIGYLNSRPTDSTRSDDKMATCEKSWNDYGKAVSKVDGSIGRSQWMQSCYFNTPLP